MEEDYPYDKSSGEGKYIIDYSIVALDLTFFIFGGDAGDTDLDKPFEKAQYVATKTIAAFSTITKQWKKIGKLNNARYSHGVFLQKGAFVIFGGIHGEHKPCGNSDMQYNCDYSGPIATERCMLNGYTMFVQCEDIGPLPDLEGPTNLEGSSWELEGGYARPEMMAVHADYCN